MTTENILGAQSQMDLLTQSWPPRVYWSEIYFLGTKTFNRTVESAGRDTGSYQRWLLFWKRASCVYVIQVLKIENSGQKVRGYGKK